MRVSSSRWLQLAAAVLLAGAARADVSSVNITERDSDGRTALHKLALYDWGSLDDVKALIARGADVNATDKDGDTPLHLAAMFGQTGKAKYLVEKGAATQAVNKYGATPLHYAAERRRTDTALLGLLTAKAGADPLDKEGRTPLFRAVDADAPDTVKWLIENGASPDKAKADGELPLHRALTLDYGKVVSVLCEKGANVNAATKDGLTLLMYFTLRDKPETVQRLLTLKASPNAKGEGGRSAMHAAASQGNQKVMEWFLAANGDINLADGEGRTPLDYAGESKAEWAAWLKAKGAKPGQVKPKAETAPEGDEDGNTALHLAVDKGDLAAVRSLAKTSPQLVNQKNKAGVTPLMMAVANGWDEGAEALAAAGADCQAKDEDGRNLAWLAADTGKLALLKWAAGKGVNCLAADSYGRTPLHQAAYRNLECVQWLVAQGADINAKTQGGETPLACAINQEKLDVTQYLIGKGADLRGVDNGGATLLHRAARKRNPEFAKLLLAKGADVNARDKRGVTPLHRAADSKSAIATLQLLLAQGADCAAKDNTGKTPLDYATKAKNQAAVDLLK